MSIENVQMVITIFSFLTPCYADHYPVSVEQTLPTYSQTSFPGLFTILSLTTLITARLEVNLDFSISTLQHPLQFSRITPCLNNHIDFSLIGMIGVFATVPWSATQNRVWRMDYGRTGTGGICFTFQAHPRAYYHQIFFLGDIAATALVNYYVIWHQDR